MYIKESLANAKVSARQ